MTGITTYNPDAWAPEHALVTGGCGDIGSATVARLAREGLLVTVIDRFPASDGEAAVQRAAASAGVEPSRLRYASADVTDRASLERAVADAPPIDIAIANAGIGRSAPFLDLSPSEWQVHLDINLTGSFNTAQLAARSMVDSGRPGLLVFVSSWIGQIPWPEMTAYSTTKAGIEMLSKQCARELAVHGVRSNVVAPGIVRAGLARHQVDTEPQYAARAAKVVPMGSLQTVDQVADAVWFLCSPGASYMTGSMLLVDGGCSLYAFD